MQVLAKRLLTRPLIDSRMDARLEGNVNGPSLIKMPAWLKSRKAKYYLYFSHHCGDHIRLAFANKLTGPWTVYVGGVLRLSNTPFAQQKPDVPEPRWAVERGVSGLYPHIASPDVHIDHHRCELKMYFHGLDQDGEQRSLTATSKDGLTWKVHPRRIEQTYLRALGTKARHTQLLWEAKFCVSPKMVCSKQADGFFQPNTVILRFWLKAIFFTSFGLELAMLPKAYCIRL